MSRSIDGSVSGDVETLVHDVFDAIDRRDDAAFAQFLHADASFRFGNAETVTGRAAIRSAVAAFFASIESLSHRVERIWAGADAAACHGDVTYVRRDGGRVVLPFADVFVLRDGSIGEYLIYIDIAPLYQPATPA